MFSGNKAFGLLLFLIKKKGGERKERNRHDCFLRASSPAQNRFCLEYGLSQPVLREIMDTREQYLNMFKVPIGGEKTGDGMPQQMPQPADEAFGD